MFAVYHNELNKVKVAVEAGYWELARRAPSGETVFERR